MMVDIWPVPYGSRLQTFKECADVFRSVEVGKRIYNIDFCRFIARVGTLLRARDDNGKVVGVLSMTLLRSTDACFYNKHLSPGGKRISSEPPTIDALDLGVLKSHRRQGIGNLLLKHCLAKTTWGDGQHFDHCITLSRRPSGGDSSFGILRQNGFKKVGEFPDWYSDNESFLCPSCGAGGCHCTAILMEWKRDD